MTAPPMLCSPTPALSAGDGGWAVVKPGLGKKEGWVEGVFKILLFSFCPLLI